MKIAANIKKLPPVQIDTLLKQLEREKNNSDSEKKPIPRLTVWLSNGQALTGDFVAYQTPSKNESPILLLQSNVGNNSADVSYLPGHTISGLTAHVIVENLHMLAFGAINEQHVGEAPTKMNIENKVSIWSKKFFDTYKIRLEHQIGFSHLPGSEQCRFTLDILLDTIHRDLESIVGEKMGLEEVSAKIKCIQITITSEPPKISLENGSFIVNCQITSDDIKTPALNSIHQTLEGLL